MNESDWIYDSKQHQSTRRRMGKSVTTTQITQNLQTHDAGSHQIVQNYTVNSDQIGERIDKIAALVFSDYSREQIKNWQSQAN